MVWLSGVDFIIWINLDRSPDRATRMSHMLKDPAFENIPSMRFSAIDGKLPNMINKLVDNVHHQNKQLEYACLLSHLESIRYFVEKTSYNNVLILEDDATLEFKPHWKTPVKKIIANAPIGWDAINLGYMSNQLPDTEYTFNKYENGNVKYWSTIAYIINRKGAKKYLSATPIIHGKYKIQPEITPDADVYMWAFINGYVYKYPMFIYAYDETSTLNHDTKFHNESKKRIQMMYLGKKQQGPIYNIYICLFLLSIFVIVYIGLKSTRFGCYCS
jgi:GR25 family glycosyltransferase involved in LPS biosynthesis